MFVIHDLNSLGCLQFHVILGLEVWSSGCITPFPFLPRSPPSCDQFTEHRASAGRPSRWTGGHRAAAAGAGEADRDLVCSCYWGVPTQSPALWWGDETALNRLASIRRGCPLRIPFCGSDPIWLAKQEFQTKPWHGPHGRTDWIKAELQKYSWTIE